MMPFYPKEHINPGKVKSMKSNNDRHYDYHHSKDWKPWCSHSFYYKYSVLCTLWGSGGGLNALLNHDSCTDEIWSLFVVVGWGNPASFTLRPHPQLLPPLLKAKAEFGKSELGLEG